MTPDQQTLVEEAIKLVPICVRVFLKSAPGLRGVVRHDDLESAAYLACCKAARTFDRGRGVGVSAYFSVAIRNGMLREIQRELRRRQRNQNQIPMEIAEKERPPDPAGSDVFASLATLPEEERRWIERHLFEGISLRALGRQSGVSVKTVKKRLLLFLDKVKFVHDDSAFS